MTELEVYEAGWRAWFAGEDRSTANPFPRATLDHATWDDGFEHAMEAKHDDGEEEI